MPLTRNHWEATYLAEAYPLARGWHRQLDRKVNPLFYDHEHPLTAARYERWLRENAVRWVALPTAPLDFSAEAREGAAARRRCRTSSRATRRPTGASGRCATPSRPSPARRTLTAAGADGFDLRRRAPGPVLVRQHAHALLDGRRGRRLRLEGRRARAGRASTSGAPGCVRVRARFSARGALRREPRCTTAPGAAVPASAVSPPVGGR